VTVEHPLDASEEEWIAEALATFVDTRDPALRAQIVERTLWLAHRAARRFSDRGEPFDDILQVARLALIKSVDRFDPSHGVPFGAYATPTITGEIKRHFRDRTWRVHVPRRAKDLRPAVNAASEELSKELGRSPTAQEVALRLNVEEDSVLEAIEANGAYRTATLDVKKERQLRDGSVDAELDDVLNRELVAKVLSRLRPRERQIIQLRFFDEMTQSQIAELIGTSQVHVGRLITSSLALLRTHMELDAQSNS
jgi:RNA polymerase sigma-B factor